jgi:signal transduction histidine kinase
VRARIAWFVVVLSVVCAGLDTAIVALHGPMLSREVYFAHGWPIVPLATLGAAVMGALIVSRYPQHPIGWLLVVTGVCSTAVAAEAYNFWPPGGSAHDAVVAGHVVGWVGAWFGSPLAVTALIVIFLIAPDGRLHSRIERVVALGGLAGLACYLAGVASLTPTGYNVNDLGPAGNGFTAVAVWLTTVSLVASGVAIAVRLLRAHGEVRRQLLWMTAPALILSGTYSWLLLTRQFDFEAQTGFSATLLYIAYISVPICTGVAVLHHRLFEIDLIVDRALVVLLATIVVGAGYVLGVVTLGTVTPGGDGVWPSLPAMALAAIAFQPLRLRVIRVADRLAYGPAAEPYDALADFSRRLGDSPDPSHLLPAVAEATATAVKACRVTVALALPYGGSQTATFPVRADIGIAPAAELPVIGDGEVLGALSVEMPPGRALRARDTALLGDLADQAVIAFRNARLSAELAHRVDELNQQASALEESRRRLICAGDAERSRLELAIRKDVAPHLEVLPEWLDSLARHDQGAVTAELVRPLRAHAEAALEALRDITRGVYPVHLGRSGLEPALRSLLGRTAETTLVVDPVETARRCDARIEAAAYFCVAEAVRALARPIEVSVKRRGDELQVIIDGQDDPDLPLANMRDRTEAVGGTVSSDRFDGWLSLDVRLPVQRSRETAGSLTG